MSQHPGIALRAAREAQGLDLATVAQRLRLMERQIDAIEKGDFESLGQPVFARGFVRNYARLLGLDAEALVASMQPQAHVIEVQEEPEAEPARVETARSSGLGWLMSPWVLVLVCAALVVIAMPVGLYYWLNSGDDDLPPVASGPEVLAPASPDASPVEPAAPSAATTLSTLDPTTAGSTAEAGDTNSQAAAEAAGVQEQAPAVLGALEFSFLGDAWVEIRDADGKFVHRQLNRAGTRATVTGKPPFDFVVGNAREVRLAYNSRPIDLAPFIEVTVARFSLEE